MRINTFPIVRKPRLLLPPWQVYNRGMNLTPMRLIVCAFVFSLVAHLSLADEPKKAAPELPASIVPTDYLVLPVAGQYGRLPLQRDAVEAQIVAGNWKPPAAGPSVKAPGGKMCVWSAVKAAEDGTLDTQKIRGGYAYATFDSPAERVMILEAGGHALVFVNGQPPPGRPHATRDVAV